MRHNNSLNHSNPEPENKEFTVNRISAINTGIAAKVFSLVLLLLSTVVFYINVSAQTGTFQGIDLGPIPDAPGAGPANYGSERSVRFSVTGLSRVTRVSVSFRANHEYVGDLRVKLRAPNGFEHILFERTGATTAGSAGFNSSLSSSNLYNFDDLNSTNWWSVAGSGTVPQGFYRTTVAGGAGIPNPAPVTSMSNVFQNSSSNGTWRLIFQDGWSGQTGEVTAATLSIISTPTTFIVDRADDALVSGCQDGIPNDCTLRGAIDIAETNDSQLNSLRFLIARKP